MPKSKRSQVVTLTKTVKKTRLDKENLLNIIREALDKFEHVYIFKVDNMRNSFIKEARQEMKESARFFFGRNKVMAKALGTSEEEEYKTGLSGLSCKLEGNVGLLVTNYGSKQVEEILSKYNQSDYARSGCIATQTVTIPKGPVTRGADQEKFPNNMEPQFRALGMPTRLIQGVITLGRDYTICQEGKPLTTEAAHLLKHFYIQMAQFKIELLYHWHQGIVECVHQNESIESLIDQERED